MGISRLLVLALFVFLTACQTDMKKAFEEIKPGMDKDQVLQIIGGPRAVTRFHDKDRWFITFYHDKIRYEKEIHFKNGFVTYVGEPYEPPPENQAANVDKKNQESDAKTYSELIKARSNADNAQEEYEKKVKGQDKVRYVPNFVPVQ